MMKFRKSTVVPLDEPIANSLNLELEDYTLHSEDVCIHNIYIYIYIYKNVYVYVYIYIYIYITGLCEVLI